LLIGCDSQNVKVVCVRGKNGAAVPASLEASIPPEVSKAIRKGVGISSPEPCPDIRDRFLGRGTCGN